MQNSPKIKIRRKYKTWTAWRKAQRGHPPPHTKIHREHHDIYQKMSKETGRRRLGCSAFVFVCVIVQRISSLAAKKTKRKSTKSAQKSQDKATKIDTVTNQGETMFAEWERQKGVVMIYPHRFCDFASDIKEVSAVFDQIIYEICKVENLFLILHPNDNALQRRIRSLRSESKYIKERCTTIYIPTNDVWARDTVIISKRGAYLDFGFNGWGMKFRADLDELISQNLAQKLDFIDSLETIDMILEGGSIDYNGNGLLLTNTTCLLHENRNPHLSQSEIEDRLKTHLCAQHVLWLKHGYLLGDDTDGHIDTLARFIDEDTICYVQSTDARESKMSQERQKEHRELAEMEYELQEIAKRHGLNLLPLPICKYEYKGEPLPASYVNFLFLNDETMLMPIYGKHTDALAQQRLRQALPDYRIIPINCEALIRQHGSLHCLTMQIH